MPSLKIRPIKAFEDNYIWCLTNGETCVVVDPGDASPVLKYCARNNLILTDILITHHHSDHTGGVNELVNAFEGVTVYGPQNPQIQSITRRLQADDRVQLGSIDVEFRVLEVPGHTLDHIAYVGSCGLFCGDTLFSAGCGRLFEGTPEQMYQSLGKLTALADDTKVFCTHEYTLANLKFALAVDPENENLLNYKGWAESQRVDLKPTLPSTIGQQKEINPFLRTASQAVIAHAEQYAQQTLSTPESVFAALRAWKDNF
ncbi:Hydroxyacylglutathione hydrolase [Paraglaciecola mesophila]|uniref:Hydroxyacylglutathione hydrolase n=1 Tax=Paraglaciecola mesophila TaxID=197222 RepID=A0A857JD50_9ALTE|nr:hydroxyacylglutathione hydrolase [Paraglaciecola mesophila]QHJ09953.1 Hydroxyacylglutathione hydrolase [Paraglaciecola mesophila]